MNEFKKTHKQYEAIKTEGVTSEDIRQDIKLMEDEKDQLTKRIDRLKAKVESAPQRERLLEMGKNLRLETEKESELMQQKAEQRNMVKSLLKILKRFLIRFE